MSGDKTTRISAHISKMAKKAIMDEHGELSPTVRKLCNFYVANGMKTLVTEDVGNALIHAIKSHAEDDIEETKARHEAELKQKRKFYDQLIEIVETFVEGNGASADNQMDMRTIPYPPFVGEEHRDGEAVDVPVVVYNEVLGDYKHKNGVHVVNYEEVENPAVSTHARKYELPNATLSTILHDIETSRKQPITR